MKKTLILAMASSLALGAFGGTLLECPEKGDWKDSRELTQKEDDTLVFTGKGELHSTERFAVDPAKTIRFSGEFRKNNPSEKVMLFVAFWCWDKNNRQITPRNISPLAGTESELAAPVKKTDRTVTVRDASSLKPGMVMAFAAADDKSDLPNFNISSGTIAKTEKNADGSWLVTFSSPVHQEFPAGTRVRAHQNSGGYLYAALPLLTDTFQTVAANVSGTGNSIGKWWPGTAKAELVLFARTGTVSFKNVKLETPGK